MEALAFEFVEPSELVVPPATDQVTWVVRSIVVVEPPGTVTVPVAVYCWEAPKATVVAAGVTAMEVRTSTVRVAVADAPPEVVVMTEVPPPAGTVEAAEARPVALMVATLVFEEPQPARLLISFWLPSL
jgi:hypothetical protein